MIEVSPPKPVGTEGDPWAELIGYTDGMGHAVLRLMENRELIVLIPMATGFPSIDNHAENTVS